MAKEKVKKTGSDPAVEKGPVTQVENQAAEAKPVKEPPYKFETTDGKVISGVSVEMSKRTPMVNASYGPEGKTEKLTPHVLTPEQFEKYTELAKTDLKAAKDYIVKAALPMHADDKAFKNTAGVVNGREVDFVVIHKYDAKDVENAKPEDKAKVQSYVDKNAWRIRYGKKDDWSEGGQLTGEEVEKYSLRGEPVKNANGYTYAVGAPLSKLDIANLAAPRILAVQADRLKSIETVQKTDWSRFKFPENANIERVHFGNSKEHPDRIFANAVVNGTQVSALLTKNQTFAYRNGYASMEQAFMANNDFRGKVDMVLHPEKIQAKMDEQKAKSNDQKAAQGRGVG